jgi:hypothetical protein
MAGDWEANWVVASAVHANPRVTHDPITECHVAPRICPSLVG